MNADSTLSIGLVWDGYRMDMQTIGITGNDANETASKMAQLWYGLFLLRGLGYAYPAQLIVNDVPPQLTEHVAGWLEGLDVRMDAIIVAEDPDVEVIVDDLD